MDHHRRSGIYSTSALFSFPIFILSYLILSQILKEATLFFSQEGISIAAVIPAMDAIDEVFATGMLNNALLLPPICHALTIGKHTLNKYYSLTDDLDLFCMAIGTFFSSFLFPHRLTPLLSSTSVL